MINIIEPMVASYYGNNAKLFSGIQDIFFQVDDKVIN